MHERGDPLQRALRILAAAAWAAIVLWAMLHRQDFTLERILHYTPESPPLAFAALMLLFALKSLTVVFYTGLLYAAAGVLFPLPAALLVSLCGTLVASAIPYLLAGRIGARRADELRERYPKLKAFERIRSSSPLAFVVVLRCVNVINFDVGSMFCGAVRMAPAPFLLGSALGKLADVVLWTAAGTTLSDPSPVPFAIAYAADLLIALCVTAVVLRRSRQDA